MYFSVFLEAAFKIWGYSRKKHKNGAELPILCAVSVCGCNYFAAMTSISTSPSLGSWATAKQERAGLLVTKYWL